MTASHRHGTDAGRGSASAEVVALVLGREARARLQAGLRARAVAHFVATCQELAEAVAGPRVLAAIVDLRDAEGVLTASVVRQLRERFPLLPVIAYCAPTTSASSDLLAVARVPPSGLIMGGIDDVGVRLGAVLDCAADDCVARLAWAALSGHVRGPGRPIVEHCLANAREAPTVDGVARALGMHRKTLRRRLAQDGLPEPQRVIGWCRLLLAARLLEEPGRPAEHVALQLNFPSATSLRNMLVRYTGLKPRDLRGPGGFARVLAAFLAAVRRRGASEPVLPARAADAAHVARIA